MVGILCGLIGALAYTWKRSEVDQRALLQRAGFFVDWTNADEVVITAPLFASDGEKFILHKGGTMVLGGLPPGAGAEPR